MNIPIRFFSALGQEAVWPAYSKKLNIPSLSHTTHTHTHSFSHTHTLSLSHTHPLSVKRTAIWKVVTHTPFVSLTHTHTGDFQS